MNFLIAVWGNPSGWKEVIYAFGEKTIKSNTSLRILQEIIEPDRTFIICLDTLAERGGSYQEIKANAEEKIREFANKFGLTGYEVLVAPGIGTFPNGTFQGDALDYYYYIIAKLSTILLENTENTISLHLDLTHGINYSAILTYKALKEIIEIFSIFKNVKFKAYNADPSLPAVADKLFINVIEDSQPAPTPLTEKVYPGKPLESTKNLSSKRKEEIFKSELKNVLKIFKEIDNLELSAFIGALYNGLPLALFRFYPKINKLREIIFEVLNSYEKYIKVRNQSKLEVMKDLKIGKVTKAYVFAYVIAVLLKDLGLVTSKKKEVLLDEIENLKENLFKFDERFKTRIADDIHELKKKLKERKDINWEIYNSILDKSIGEPDVRNFLAHSGFERNITEIKKEGRKIFLRYGENKIKTIKEFCQKGLK